METPVEIEKLAPPASPGPAGAKQYGAPQSFYRSFAGDWVPGLSPLNSIFELERLVYTDETIGAVLWCIESAIGQIEWKHVAQVDGKDAPDDPKAVRAAEFADQLLLDMDSSWGEHVEEAISMIWAGFAPCEIILKQRDGVNSRFSDGRWGIKGIPLRDQNTVVGWTYGPDGREIIAMQQSGGEPIPAWKLLNYRLKAFLNRPQGRSLFTNIYRIWRLKKRVQDSEAIGIDRDMAGLPTFRVPNDVLRQASEIDADGKPTKEALVAQSQIQAGEYAVSQMRFDTRGGLVIPSDPWSADDDVQTNSNVPMWDFTITTSAGARTIDTRNVIRDYDRGIARIAMMQFLHLGDRSGGSNALSDDQSSLAIRSLVTIAQKIATTYSRGALPLVWAANAMNPKYMPVLAPSDLTKDGVQQIGQYFAGLGRILPLLTDDPQARVQALALGGIKASATADWEPVAAPAPDPTKPNADPSNPGAPPAPAKPNQEEDQ